MRAARVSRAPALWRLRFFLRCTGLRVGKGIALEARDVDLEADVPVMRVRPARWMRTVGVWSRSRRCWCRTFDTDEDLRVALHGFKRLHNRAWLVQKHGYRTRPGTRGLPRRRHHGGGVSAACRARCALSDAGRSGGRRTSIPFADRVWSFLDVSTTGGTTRPMTHLSETARSLGSGMALGPVWDIVVKGLEYDFREQDLPTLISHLGAGNGYGRMETMFDFDRDDPSLVEVSFLDSGELVSASALIAALEDLQAAQSGS